jgi:hypothetical protein
MAVQHIPINSGARKGAAFRRAHDGFYSGLDFFNDMLLVGPFFIDGTPGDELADHSHFEVEYGLNSGTGWKAFAEVASLMAKLNNNTSQTDVFNALRQVRKYFA